MIYEDPSGNNFRPVNATLCDTYISGGSGKLFDFSSITHSTIPPSKSAVAFTLLFEQNILGGSSNNLVLQLAFSGATQIAIDATLITPSGVSWTTTLTCKPTSTHYPSATAVASTTTPTTATTPASASSTPAASNGTDAGTIAGIVIGSVVGAG